MYKTEKRQLKKKSAELEVPINKDNICGVETGHLVTPYSTCCLAHRVMAKISPTTKRYLAIILINQTIIFQAEVRKAKHVRRINDWKKHIKDSLEISKNTATIS